VARRWLIYFIALALFTMVAMPMRVIGASGGLPANTSLDGVDGVQVTDDQVAAAAAERATYGLPADLATVGALLSSSRDVGTPKWGIAMTAEEESALDIRRRMRFANDLENNLLAYAGSLDTFAGAWIDQANGGGAVVMLTNMTTEAQAEISSRLPADNLGVRVIEADWSLANLQAAVSPASEAWTRLDGPRLLSIYVDERRNTLVALALKVDQELALEAAARVVSELGVPIAVVADAAMAAHDVACTSRSACSNPYKAGILIREGAVTGEPPCTLAFPIVVSGDIQVLTAGHCGYYGDSWYHPGEGRVGLVQSNLWAPGGKDILRLSMYDWQASELVYGYGETDQYSSAGLPIQGETLCASLGMSNRNDCATVEYTYGQYWSDTTGFWVWGGKLRDLTPIPIIGDSGSPISRRVYVTGSNPHWTHTPVGVLTTQWGEFARIRDALDVWGATIWTG